MRLLCADMDNAYKIYQLVGPHVALVVSMLSFGSSCNATCQRDHWKSGHKTDCASFKQPPLAKNFDPSDRADVPWPLDPIFAQGNKDGLGIWLTTAGSLSSS